MPGEENFAPIDQSSADQGNDGGNESSYSVFENDIAIPLEQEWPQEYQPEPGEQADQEYAEQPQMNRTQQETVTLNIDGEPVEVPIREATRMMQMGADYTRKTQQLAEMRRQLEPYMKMQELVKTNPQLEQEMTQLLYERTTGMPYNPKVVQAQTMIKELQDQKQEVEFQSKSLGWANKMMDFQKSYGLTDAEVTTVAQVMAAERIANPRIAMDAIKHRLQSYYAEKAQARPPVMGGSSYGAPPPANRQLSTFDDAKKAALSYLRGAARQDNAY